MAKKLKQPARARKTIRRDKLHPVLMEGENAPRKVIDHGHVYQYVGIGWVDEGAALPADYQKYPRVIN
jgi:hypothetical protein